MAKDIPIGLKIKAVRDARGLSQVEVVYFADITKGEAEDIFNQINDGLTRPTRDTFEDQYRKAFI